MRRLIEHVLALPAEVLPALTIQDAAICHVWLANGGAAAEPFEGVEALASRLKQWLAVADPQISSSEGRRSQTLLRELIDRAQCDEVDKMARDELDLLETVYAFAHAAQRHPQFERVRRLIAPRRARIAARRTKIKPAVCTPALTRRMLVVRPEDISRSAAREVKILAGVELPARGPVLSHSGHLRVLGDVPENTTVVVEEADCVVDGYVLGRVAASGNCELRENVSGVVISRNGDVRARHILSNAFVVSKRGRVQCRKVQGARMVFAGDALQIVESTLRSLMFAPAVTVGESVASGRVHVSRQLSAGELGGGDDAIEIWLRAGISCRDYGENVGRSMSADVGRALRARSKLSDARSRVSLTIQESEQTAETCLMYLLAPENSGRAAEEIVSAQRRLDVLNRIVLGLRSIYAEVEANSGDEDSGEPGSGDRSVLDRIDSELNAMMEEVPEDDPVRAMYAELEAARGDARGNRSRGKLLKTTLEETAEKIGRWHKEAEQLRESIRGWQEKLAKTGRIQEIVGGEGRPRSRIVALQKILARAKGEPAESRLRVRAESTFIAKMMRNIDKRLGEARSLNSEMVELRSEFESARELLLNRYQMRIDEDGGFDRRLEVEGAFLGQVKLFHDPRYISDWANETDTAPAHVASHSNGARMRYACAGGEFVSEEVESDEPAEAAATAIA